MSPEQLEAQGCRCAQRHLRVRGGALRAHYGQAGLRGQHAGKRHRIDPQRTAAADHSAVSDDVHGDRSRGADLSRERPGQAMAVCARGQTRARLGIAGRARHTGSPGTEDGRHAIAATVAGCDGRGSARDGRRDGVGESAARRARRPCRFDFISRLPQARRSRPTSRSRRMDSGWPSRQPVRTESFDCGTAI